MVFAPNPESTLPLWKAPEDGDISVLVSPKAVALTSTADSNICTAVGMDVASCTGVYLLACLSDSIAPKSCGQAPHVQRIANPAVFCGHHNSCTPDLLLA